MRAILYMNETGPHSNESNPEDRMVKIGLKELKVTYLYQQGALSFSFWWLNHRNSEVSKLFLEQFYVR